MKRKGALTAMVALLLGVLAECGGGGSSTSTSNNGGGSNGSGSPLASGTELLYVGDNVGVIHGFGIDPSSGKLTLIQSTNVTNAQAAADVNLTADAGSGVLYATSAGLGGPNVASFIVDRKTGELTSAGPAQTLSIPPRNLVAAGNSLYVIPDGSANAADVFVFHIDVNGVLSLLPNQPISLPGVPHDLAVDPSLSWLFVTFDGNSGGEIASFSIKGGTLGSMAGTFSTGESPQGVKVTPDGKLVVVANGGTSNVSVFSLNPSTGNLTEVLGSPFACAAGAGTVAIDPGGKFVFVTVGLNADGNTLFGYTIDSAGSLTPVPETPTALGGGTQGIGVAVDPSDKFVYTTIVGREVAGFMLDPSTGGLTGVPGSPFGVGQVTRGLAVMPDAIQ